MKLVEIIYTNKPVQLLGHVDKPFPRLINQKAFQRVVFEAASVSGCAEIE
jgi:hypothetical protein